MFNFVVLMILKALGFGTLGPIGGTFCPQGGGFNRSSERVRVLTTLGTIAAVWQAYYGGFVPAGGLFALLQRMGMTVGT